MKSFRKLLKGTTGTICFVFFFVFLLVFVAIYEGTKNSLDYFVGITFISILFIILMLLIIAIYGIVVYYYYTKAKAKLREIPNFSEERFERETKRAPKIMNVLLCSDAICYSNTGFMVRTIPIQDIIWAYQELVQASLVIQIYTRDKEKHSVAIQIKKKFGNTDAACRYVLRLIARKNKGALIGYTEEYDELYKHDFPRFLIQTQGRELVDSWLLEQEYIENHYYEKDFQ